MPETSELQKEILSLDLNQYEWIDPKELPFSKEVRDMCAQNACGRHGTNWQCPPGAGELSVLEARAKSYPKALLFNMVYKIEDSYDFEGMMAAKDRFTETCKALLKGLRKYYPDSYVMGAGGCNICKECTYPNDPCRFPDRAIASMEACGIDVFSTSKKFGFEYIGGQNTVTYFGIAFFRPMIYTEYISTPAGVIKITASDQWILSVHFADSVGPARPGPFTQKCAAQLFEYFEGKRTVFDLPLKMEGTAFQQKIWQALLEIPYGETRSYEQVAYAAGSPKAMRAVGGANAHNPFVIIVPCHRVIQKNGKTGGYTGGIWRKKILLAHESAKSSCRQTDF